ncbi:hypothetical protein OC25_02090 [Pedobacter kyungheensis]|uniref:Uncharacterized protein n=1 Tax=Pedobacter kyungheensis TaxID=1069985 RepID=A0A0C1FUG2_9SPHI|nr:hypothetical protein [Pedobacter kyungheensis]KIA96557.1 hypothetical protein OC25_02090 [Pedobacter kyungheensis]
MVRFIPIQQGIEEGRKQTLPARILLITGTLIFIGTLIILVLIIANYNKDSLNMFLVFAGIALLTFFLFIYLPFRFWRKRLLDWQAWAYTNAATSKN